MESFRISCKVVTLKVVNKMPPCPQGTFLYTIQPGDTLWHIAQRYRITIPDIVALNPGLDMYNLYVGQVICIADRSINPCISKTQMDLNNIVRMLWEQHVFWTRLAIVSMVFGLPDVEPVTGRLLRNPQDFAEALRGFYGDQVAMRFADLLREHLVIAAQLVQAAKAGDSSAAGEAERKWYANVNAIAAFLGTINPFWSESQWRNMLHEHLAMTKAEAVAMLNQNYEESIRLMDQIEKQALVMADVMINGLIKQFSDRLRT